MSINYNPNFVQPDGVLIVSSSTGEATMLFSASFRSQPINLQFQTVFGAVLTITGSQVKGAQAGLFTMSGSMDGTNWYDITGSSFGTTGSYLIRDIAPVSSWYSLGVTRSAGGDTLSCTASLKASAR